MATPGVLVVCVSYYPMYHNKLEATTCDFTRGVTVARYYVILYRKGELWDLTITTTYGFLLRPAG